MKYYGLIRESINIACSIIILTLVGISRALFWVSLTIFGVTCFGPVEGQYKTALEGMLSSNSGESNLTGVE